MTPDPTRAALADPDHAHDPHGALTYDARCWMCRNVTAQPRPQVGHQGAALAATHQGRQP